MKTQKKEVVIPKVLEKLKLQNCSVIFYNAVDEGFGTSITINATDPEVKEKISQWVKANNIGKETPGIAKFKEYSPDESDDVTIQYSFRINDFTKYMGVDGLKKEDLGFGAVIDLVANPFAFDNKYGKAVSASLSAVLIKEKGKTGSDSDMQELLDGMEMEDKKTVEPINAFK
jgi:hypothetical protein